MEGVNVCACTSHMTLGINARVPQHGITKLILFLSKFQQVGKYFKLVTITLGTMSKFGFIPYGTNSNETIINLEN
ncbi:hypothetical protein BpHYR1_012414 [Brachionus plicatilis]|uniref:Uncharacterized protein n=1 Tax=Brachionus plicatilis TaxID=10195 RepID=A0A3M7QNM2_BRAPC|nr:hypothetical protein BpHYR1_012414 [Brachionus plicatilis]